VCSLNSYQEDVDRGVTHFSPFDGPLGGLGTEGSEAYMPLQGLVKVRIIAVILAPDSSTGGLIPYHDALLLTVQHTMTCARRIVGSQVESQW
jgi:hypothetical protein